MDARTPLEITDLILSQLSVNDVLAVSLVSKANYRFANSPLLWKRLVKKDFHVEAPREYKTSYIALAAKMDIEAKRLINYITIMQVLQLQAIESVKQDSPGEGEGDIKFTPIIPTRSMMTFIEKKKAVTKQVLACVEVLDTADNNFPEFVEKEIYDQLKKMSATIITMLFSEEYKSQIVSTEEEGKSDGVLPAVFQVLCILDAAILFSKFIELHPSILTNPCVYQAFRYPCPNIIEKLLKHPIDIDKKTWINDENYQHATPLMMAWIQLSGLKKYAALKEIITCLLTNGADPTIQCYWCDEPLRSEEEYNTYATSLFDICKKLIASPPHNIPPSERNILLEIAQIVVNYPRNNLARTLSC